MSPEYETESDDGDGSIDAAVASMRAKRVERAGGEEANGVRPERAAAPEPRAEPRQDFRQPGAGAPQGDARAAATDPPAEPAGEDEPTPADAGSSPSVEPPAGWTAEDQAWFKTLPPDRQQVLAKREREFRAQESRRHNEHVEALKAIEADKAAIAAERHHLGRALQTYANPIFADFEKEFPDLIKGEVNALQIQAADPLRFQRLQAYQTQFAQMTAEQRRIEEQGRRKADDDLASFRSEQNARLIEAVPELKEPKARESFEKDIVQYLRESGYQDDRIRWASAHDLVTARKAMLYDRAQAAKTEAERKVRAERPAPAVQRPGSGRASGADGEKVAAARKVLERNPNDQDAVVALMRAKREARRGAPAR